MCFFLQNKLNIKAVYENIKFMCKPRLFHSFQDSYTSTLHCKKLHYDQRQIFESQIMYFGLEQENEMS